MKHLLIFALTSMVFVSALQAQTSCLNPPVVVITANNASPCLGDTVVLTASGALNYSWTNNVVNGVGFVPSSSETYQVIGTDSSGCSDTTTVFIDVLPLPQITANSSSLNICLGDSVALTASGAQSYSWLNPVINNGDIYTPLDTGANIFLVEGQGANGCVNTSQVIVVVRGVPAVPTLNVNSISTCLNVPFEEQIEAAVTEGRSIWFRDQALTDQYETEPELSVGNNTVGTTTFYASTFQSGCYSDPVAATVEVFGLPVIDAGSDISLEAGQRGNLSAQVSSATTVIWNPETGLSDPTSTNPDFTATNSETYTLTATDQNGCVSTDGVQVNVDNVLVVSNVMTPNGDGSNDVWKIYPETVLSTCDIQVFDGFGRKVLETNNYQNDWEGTFEGGSLPDGDYYYLIEGDGISEKGTLVIIR